MLSCLSSSAPILRNTAFSSQKRLLSVLASRSTTTSTTTLAADGRKRQWQSSTRFSFRHRWNNYQCPRSTSNSLSPSATPKFSNATSPPTYEQLRILAFRSAIPMVGFGIMDNVVMITAGEAIDSTFGVALGISTMAAAGLGQCCSDVAGLTSGGIVDAAVSKLNLPTHGLSTKQLDTRLARVVGTCGACVGVVTGCLIGMSVLLCMDTDKADKAKRAKKLQSIFESVMNDGHYLVQAERATLFLLDNDTDELWSRVATGTDGILKVPRQKGCVGHCVTTGRILNVPDAYQNPHFDGSFDETTGYKTISVLVVPIRSNSGEVIGAIQMMNKRETDVTKALIGDDDGDSKTIAPFTTDDEKIVSVLASHVATFIRVVEGS